MHVGIDARGIYGPTHMNICMHICIYSYMYTYANSYMHIHMHWGPMNIYDACSIAYMCAHALAPCACMGVTLRIVCDKTLERDRYAAHVRPGIERRAYRGAGAGAGAARTYAWDIITSCNMIHTDHSREFIGECALDTRIDDD